MHFVRAMFGYDGFGLYDPSCLAVMMLIFSCCVGDLYVCMSCIYVSATIRTMPEAFCFLAIHAFLGYPRMCASVIIY